jgi:M6 family metalloprotease-like protein
MGRRANTYGWLMVVVLLSTLVPLRGDAQAREISGRLEVLWGMLPTLEGKPTLRYLVFDDATRRNVEIRFGEHTADRFGGPIAMNGKRVQLLVAEEPSPTGPVTRVMDVRSAAADPFGRSVPDLLKRLEDNTPSSHSGHGANLVSGSRKYLTILCKFNNKTAEPGTKTQYETFFSGPSMSVAHYWGEVSENRLNFDGSLTIGWLTMANDSAYYFPNGATDANLERLATDCTAAADPLVDFTQFHGIITQFNNTLGCCGWGGGRTMTLDGQTKSYGFVWLPPHGTPPSGVGFVTHEVGHSLGLPHSGGPYGRTYDSKWDVMSGAHAYLDPATNKTFGATTVSYHKLLLEWIPNARKFVATAPLSTVVVERHSLPGPNNYQVVVVPIRGTNHYYTIESRRRAGYDALLALEGVVIHHVQPTGRDEPAWVVDADGNGDPNDAGATWVPGETFVDHRNQISITVDSLTGNAYRVTVRTGGSPLLALGVAGKATSVTAGAAAILDSVPVTVSGVGNTGWTASKKNGRGAWLEFVTASGTGSGPLRLRRNPAGLGVGTYVDTVLVRLAGGMPEQYVDTLTVQDGGAAFLGLSLRSRNDSSLYYSVLDSATVQITGPGASTTAWTATKKRATTSFQTSTGTGPGKVRWYHNAGTTTPGLYIDTITVTANSNPALTAAIVDTFRVLETVAVTLTPRTRRDSMPEGAPLQLDSTIVSLNGRWATTGKLESWNYYWLRAGKFIRAGRTDPNGYYESRTGNATIHWTRGPRNLAAGTYIDTLTVCGPYCWYSAVVGQAGYQYIVDTLKVFAGPLALATSASSRRDTTALALNISKDSVMVLLTGAGAGTKTWTAVSRTAKSILISDGAFVDPGTGTGSGWLRWSRNLVGRSAGTYVDTIVVSATGVSSVSVFDTVVVLPSAALTLGRSHGRRPVIAGASSVPDSVDVNILGSAGGTATWTATARAAFTTLTTSGGTGSGRIRFTRNTTTFVAGQSYVDTLTVTSPGTLGGAVAIVDTLDAVSGALVSLSATARVDSAAVGVATTSRDSVQVQLSGANGATAAWTATKRGAWTTLVTSGGTGPGYLKWTRSNAGLTIGSYRDTLVVTSVGAAGSPITVIDEYRIVPAASIALSAETRVDSGMAGASGVRADSVIVTMSGIAASTAAWTAANKRASTTLTTASGTGSGPLRWARSAASLASGTYVDTITVTSASTGATAKVVIDTFRVLTPTAVQIPPATHSVLALQGGSRARGDSAQAILIGYAASASQWTATKSGAWTTLTTATGTTGQRVRWTRNQTGLGAGTYVDTIRVSVAGSPAAAATIVDTLRVVAITGLDAARHLLGTATLTVQTAPLLDAEGNADGTFNLGDVLAHLDRTGTVLTNAVLAALVGAPAHTARPADSTRVAPRRQQ